MLQYYYLIQIFFLRQMKDINDFKSYKKSCISALELYMIRFAWQVSLSFIDIEPYVQIIFTPTYSKK